MAYAKAGQYGPEAILDASGDLMPGREVQVDLVGTSTPATLYTDADRTDEADNPVLIDATGHLTFYADPGRYDIKVLTIGVPGAPLTVPVPPDPSEADTDVANLQTQINTITTTLASLGVAGLQADVDSLQTDLAALQTTVSTLQTDFTNHTTQVITHTREEVHTWALLGDGGTSTVVVPYAVNEAAGETVKVARAVYRCSAGTPTLKLQKNGGDLTGFTGMVASAVQATTDPADQDVVDRDELSLVCTAGAWTGWLYVSVLLTRSKTI